jgi:phenylalanyl-tRNA synthetase beta chain
VLEVVKHPDADRLNVCKVDTGRGEPTTIVCGAPNVAVGLRVPCALPGAKLARRFRYQDRQGARHRVVRHALLGQGTRHCRRGFRSADPAGRCAGWQSIRQYLDLDDNQFELKLTPNRADCLSLTGVAREVAAIAGAQVKLSMCRKLRRLSPTSAVVLDAPAALPALLRPCLKGVDAKAPTPEWMKRRLERSGIRSISALVDVTNYVMLELGQPLHAFDNTKLEGAVHARMAKAGRKAAAAERADDRYRRRYSGHRRRRQSRWPWPASWAAKKAASRWKPVSCSLSRPSSRRRRLPAVPVATDLVPMPRTVSSVVSILAVPRAIERATQLILDICGGAAGPVSKPGRHAGPQSGSPAHGACRQGARYG